MTIKITKEDADRFSSYISFGFGGNACWTWMGGISFRDGRGRFWVDGDTRTAPVISYLLHKGEIPDGLYVCHECDNPSCVNPKHLFLGTSLDNVNDMIEKGRKAILRGEDAARSKLSNSDATEIRKLAKDGLSQAKIARMFNVTPNNISRIVLGYTFRNV